MPIVLQARPPFSLQSVIHSHGWFQLAPFQEDGMQGGIQTVLQLDSGKVVRIAIVEKSGGVLVTPSIEMTSSEETEVSQKVTWMLGLDQDFSTFYALAEGEPKLAKARQHAQGRILRSPSLFEDVIKTILTTNTLWAATRRMNANLVDQFGAPLADDPQTKAFPTPASIAASDEDVLRAQTRLGYRAPSIFLLAQRVASGEFDLEGLKISSLPSADLRKVLLSIRGIGPYASANLLMLLGHYDCLTVDSWAMKVVSDEWYAGAPVTPAQVEAAFEKWGNWKGLVYWLWDFDKKYELEGQPNL